MANGGIIGPVNDPIIESTDLVTTFTASGPFTARTGQPSVDYLVVGGGGAGGTTLGGGGGAGGYRTSFPGGSQIAVPSSPVPVTVGGGELEEQVVVDLDLMQLQEQIQYF